MIPYLAADDPFPPVDRALHEPNGLLAAGADLSTGRLLEASMDKKITLPAHTAEKPASSDKK